VCQALQNGGSQQPIVYDSRAAIYEKLGRTKEALLDVKSAMRLAPNRWQCYARGARLFRQCSMWEKALNMIDIAMRKIPVESSASRAELIALKEELESSQKQATCHLAKLPVELLTEIFKSLVLDDSVNVLLLARICKHWRGIALNTPFLWSTLVLSKKRPVLKSLWWTQRSRGRIHELRLRQSLTLDTGWSFDNLRDLSWDYLRICHLESFDIVPCLKNSCRRNVLSNLAELSVCDKGAPARDPLLAQLESPLQRLYLEGASFQLTSLSANVTSLVSLVLRRTSQQTLDSLCTILLANPLLENLTIETTNFKPLTELPSSTLTLPHLTTLDLCGHGLPPDLFQAISCPAVRNVRIRQCLSASAVLERLLEDEAKELVQLTIASCAISSSVVLQLLTNNSLLESVTFNRLSGVATPALDALSSPEICPRLKHLDVSHCPDIKTGPLVNLIKSRSPIVAAADLVSSESVSSEEPLTPVPSVERIDSLVVDGCPYVESDFIPWFQKRLGHFSCVYQSGREARWKR